jgi:hypothetical protein
MMHTVACESARASRERAIARWVGRWPKHCRTCLARADCAWPCQDCMSNWFTCPRCGTKGGLHPEDATRPCTTCGWVEQAGMGCPEEYECKCRVAQAEERQRIRSGLERQRADIDRRLQSLR